MHIPILPWLLFPSPVHLNIPSCTHRIVDDHLQGWVTTYVRSVPTAANFEESWHHSIVDHKRWTRPLHLGNKYISPSLILYFDEAIVMVDVSSFDSCIRYLHADRHEKFINSVFGNLNGRCNPSATRTLLSIPFPEPNSRLTLVAANFAFIFVHIAHPQEWLL